VKKGKKKTFYVHLENKADSADEITLKSTNTSGVTVKYLMDGTDVTKAMNAGTLKCGPNACVPNGGLDLQMAVTMKPSAGTGSVQSVTVTATSKGDPRKKDVVKATAKALG
jgi:hypothetical protein